MAQKFFSYNVVLLFRQLVVSQPFVCLTVSCCCSNYNYCTYLEGWYYLFIDLQPKFVSKLFGKLERILLEAFLDIVMDTTFIVLQAKGSFPHECFVSLIVSILSNNNT